MRKILGDLKRRHSAACYVLQSAYAITLLFLVSASALGGEETKAEHSPEQEYSIHEILKRFEKETGYLVRLVDRSSSELEIETPLSDSHFPRTIESLTELLGIEDYATVFSGDDAEIKLIILQTRLGTATRASQEQSSIGFERPPRAAVSESPALTPEEQALVLSIYEGAAENGPNVDTTLTEDDRRKLHEGVPFGEPYLTDVEEDAVLKVFEKAMAEGLAGYEPEPRDEGGEAESKNGLSDTLNVE